MFFHNINYVLVLIAAIAGMIVGAIWYSPYVFLKAWMASRPGTHEQLSAKFKNDKPQPATWPVTFLFQLVTAFVIAALFNSLIVTSFGGMVVLALCVWLAFSVPAKLSDYFFGGDSLKHISISLGYQLVVIMVMTLIIGIWS